VPRLPFRRWMVSKLEPSASKCSSSDPKRPLSRTKCKYEQSGATPKTKRDVRQYTHTLYWFKRRKPTGLQVILKEQKYLVSYFTFSFLFVEFSRELESLFHSSATLSPIQPFLPCYSWWEQRVASKSHTRLECKKYIIAHLNTLSVSIITVQCSHSVIFVSRPIIEIGPLMI
jgi:hypothetical protein